MEVNSVLNSQFKPKCLTFAATKKRRDWRNMEINNVIGGMEDKFKTTFQRGCWMRVGDGRNTKFWKDKWLGDIFLKVLDISKYLFKKRK